MTICMSASAESRAPQKSTAGATILLVDDSDAVLEHLSGEFLKRGYRPVTARDGVEAQALLAQHSDVSLAIVDLHMPNMNGQELLEHVRAIPGLEKLPVVILTTDRKPANLDRAVMSGATGWVLKPYEPERLIDTVGKIIQKSA